MYTLSVMQGGNEKLAQLIVDFYNGEEEGFDDRVKRMLPLSNEGQSKLEWNLKILHDERQRFKHAVDWLCGPKPPAPRLFTLQDFGLEPLPGPSLFGSERDPFTDESAHLAYLEKHGMKHFKLLPYVKDGRFWFAPQIECFVDALCAFLLAECAGKYPEDMPIKLCLGCGKLFSVTSLSGQRRRKKEHCSKGCQRRGWWSKERHRDDVYVKRLEEYKLAALRRRLENPKVQKRLEKIKNTWKDWPTIIKRVSEIEEALNGNHE
jgi:hypothetical protein